jgi:hypothetical protein
LKAIEVRKSKTVIVALESKAVELRRVAHDLGFNCTESAIPDEPGVIKFTFDLTKIESSRLISLVPRDAYARRAYLR